MSLFMYQAKGKDKESVSLLCTKHSYLLTVASSNSNTLASSRKYSLIGSQEIFEVSKSCENCKKYLDSSFTILVFGDLIRYQEINSMNSYFLSSFLYNTKNMEEEIVCNR